MTGKNHHDQGRTRRGRRLGLRRLGADLRPLRTSRDFRLVFGSRTVTLFGSQATEVALLVQASGGWPSPGSASPRTSPWRWRSWSWPGEPTC